MHDLVSYDTVSNLLFVCLLESGWCKPKSSP